MKYRPENPPATSDGVLVEYLFRELTRLADVLATPQVDAIVINVRYAEPQRPLEGMVVKADGTSWDPGSGAGLYVYEGGTWKKFTVV